MGAGRIDVKCKNKKYKCFEEMSSEKYRGIMLQISDRLLEADIEAIKFYFSKIGLGVLEKAKTSIQLIQTLERHIYLGKNNYNAFVETLNKVGRNDLAKLFPDKYPLQEHGYDNKSNKENLSSISSNKYFEEEREYHHVMVKIARTLMNKDIEAIKLYYSNRIGYGILENIKTPFDLITCLESNSLVGVNFYSEFADVLVNIERNDLVKIFSVNRQLTANSLPLISPVHNTTGFQQVDQYAIEEQNFRRMMVKIAIGLLDKDVEAIKLYYSNQIGECDLEQIKTSFDLIKYLEIRLLVEVNNYKEFVNVLITIKRNDLAKLLSDSFSPLNVVISGTGVHQFFENERKHRCFMVKIALNLMNKDVEAIKFYYSDQFGHGLLENAETSIDLIIFLKERMLVGVNNYNEFVKVLVKIKRYDLVKLFFIYRQLTADLLPSLSVVLNATGVQQIDEVLDGLFSCSIV